MADRVLPLTQLFFPCESALLDLADEKWVLKRPYYTVELPQGMVFPFRVRELWLYAQLVYGVGNFNLSIQFVDQESGIVLGTSSPVQRSFDVNTRQHALEEVFHLRGLTFPRAGVYEFRVIGNHKVLDGGIATVRVYE